MKRLLGAALAGAVWLTAITIAPAQTTTGSFKGTVEDADGNPIAAVIILTGASGERTLVVEDDGRFLAGFLTPGVYQVRVEAPDVAALDDEIRIGLGQRLERHYAFTPEMQEQMQVVGRARRAIDFGSQATGANITSEMAEAIPLGQNVSSMVLLSPGVKDGGGTGTANPSISGSSGLENQYVFNGVNITNAGYGALGGYSIVHGSRGQGINYHFVTETQVVTGGFSAEFGQATGGIVNVLTKSGTNELGGSLYGYFTPTGLQADFITPDYDPPFGPTTGVERLNYGFDVGGPIKKDKAFFWFGLNPSSTSTTRTAPGPEYGLWDRGEMTLKQDSLNYAAKLSFTPRPEHRIDVTLFGDPTDTNLSFNRGSATLRQPDERQFSQLDFGGRHWVIDYKGEIRPDFLVEATIANANSTFDETFPKQFDSHRFIDLVPTYSGGGSERLGGIGFFETSESDNTQFTLKLTNFIDRHELRYGVGFEDIDYTAAGDYTGPEFVTHSGVTTSTGAIAYRDLDCSLVGDAGVSEWVTITDQAELDSICPPGMYTAPFDVPVFYSVVRGKISDKNVETSSEYLYVFVQDDWRITDDFTLSMGMRWEQESLVGRDVTYNLPSEWSPRLGFTWDHTGEGRSKVYGHFGRFHEKVPLDIAVRLFSNEVQILQGDYYDSNLLDPVPCSDTPDPVTGECDRYFPTGFGTTDVIDGTRTSRVDELVLGYQRQLGNLWTVKAEWQYRELKRVLEDFQLGSASGIELGTDGFGSYVVGNIPPEGMTAPGTSFPKPERQYMALTLSATATAPRWSFTGQYTLSSLHGNYEGLFRNDNGQSDPNLTSLFDFPNEELFQFTYANGKLNTDRTHRLQGFGYYKWANGWSIGSRVLAQSGTPRLRLASHPVYGNGGEISLDRRGKLGRTPTQWSADLNFAKEFKLKDKLESTISIEVDVFNLFNHRYGTTYDYDWDLASGVDVCDVGVDPRCPTVEDALAILIDTIDDGPRNPNYGNATAYNRPREMRIGFKWKF